MRESASGVAEGENRGLTSDHSRPVCLRALSGSGFPVNSAQATAPALIIVGLFMLNFAAGHRFFRLHQRYSRLSYPDYDALT